MCSIGDTSTWNKVVFVKCHVKMVQGASEEGDILNWNSAYQTGGSVDRAQNLEAPV